MRTWKDVLLKPKHNMQIPGSGRNMDREYVARSTATAYQRLLMTRKPGMSNKETTKSCSYHIAKELLRDEFVLLLSFLYFGPPTSRNCSLLWSSPRYQGGDSMAILSNDKISYSLKHLFSYEHHDNKPKKIM